jgi:hypothetical protein
VCQCGIKIMIDMRFIYLFAVNRHQMYKNKFTMRRRSSNSR